VSDGDLILPHRPAVSVVVPTYDRPDRLARCLDALARCEAPDGGFEVVVVDDGSPEPLDDVVDRFRDRLDLRLERQAKAGPAAARNTGAALARGRLLAFTDDDCTPEPAWLIALAAAAEAAPGAMLGGRTRNGAGDDRYAEASQALADRISPVDEPRFFPSNNLAVPADGFAAVGGFDTRFARAAGEDRDLCHRWIGSGRALAAVPEAVLWHHHRFTFRSYWRQHHNYGRGAFRFRAVEVGRSGDDLGIRGVGGYLGLVLDPLRRRPGRRGAIVSGLVAISQAAVASGYAAEKLDQRRSGHR
jgi:glycosyltransferase involved in cell wall biosynthesis